MRGLFRGVVGLLLFIFVIGGGAGYWVFLRGEELLRSEVLKQVRKLLPNASIEISGTHFDWENHIRISDLTLTLKDESVPALRVPEIVVSLDREQFSKRQIVIVHGIKFIGPEVTVIRNADGVVNWQGLNVVSPGDGPLPDIEIDHGVVALSVISPETGQPVAVMAREVDVRLTPIDLRALKLERCDLRVEGAGPLKITGQYRMDGPVYDFRLSLLQLPLGDSLLPWLASESPAVANQIRNASQQMQAELARQAASDEQGPTSQISWQHAPLPASAPVPVGSFGVNLLCDVTVEVHRTETDELPTFLAHTAIRSGQISNPILPFSLHELQGEIFIAPGQVAVRNLAAQNGATRLVLAADYQTGAETRVIVDAESLVLDAAMKRRLPESLRKIVDSMGLTGTFDLHTEAVRDETGLWQKTADATLRDGIVTPEKFPYTVRDITGRLELKDEILNLSAKGQANGVAVTAVGLVKRPGPEADVLINIEADGVPIDKALITASPPSVGRSIELLQLQGQGDVRVRLIRPAGLGQKFEPQIIAQLHDCTMCYRQAPYQIDQLRGMMKWMGGDLIEFRKLEGVHSGAVLTGEAEYHREPAPGRLALRVAGRNATFDDKVEFALPQNLKEVWTEISPRGQFDINFEVDWVANPGEPPVIRVPEIKVSQGEMLLRQFPYKLNNVRATFAYDAPRLMIKSFVAENEETRISLVGHGDIPGRGPWSLEFDRLDVDDITFDPALRQALPQSLRNVVDALQPTGVYSFHGPLTLVGPDRTGESVSAAWQAGQIVFTGCGLNAGLRAEGIHGSTEISGRTTPISTEVWGNLQLDSLSVMKHQLTDIKGPWEFMNGKLVAGAREDIEGVAPVARGESAVAAVRKPLTANAIGGVVVLSAVAYLRDKPVYEVVAGINRGRLEEYARRYFPGSSNLAGEMNGRLKVKGEGTEASGVQGTGSLRITQAALYELPVFVQLMRLQAFQPLDKRAFHHAEVLAQISNSKITLTSIQLEGSPISMSGEGVVGLSDGAMALRLYSRLPSRIGIPGLRQIADWVSSGWVGVYVRGTVGSAVPPVVEMIPAPMLNEALQNFRARMQPRPVGPPPTFSTPPRSSEVTDPGISRP